MKKFEIRCCGDVARFLAWLTFEKGIDVNPDDPLKGYCDKEGVPVFTDEEADYYDTLMEDAVKVCERESVSIYQLCAKLSAVLWLCNGKPTLAGLYDAAFRL